MALAAFSSLAGVSDGWFSGVGRGRYGLKNYHRCGCELPPSHVQRTSTYTISLNRHSRTVRIFLPTFYK